MITVIGNLKGGTGKSTVAFNLALWLLESGHDVDLCDLDPQATLRDAADVRVELGFEPTLSVWGRVPSKAKGQVLIDVGVSDQPAMRRALAKADRILIPVAPSQADVWSTQQFVDILAFSDVLPAFIKTFFFGFAIGIIGCYKGYTSNKGTEGVGLAANSAVVVASLMVFILDLLAVQITDLLGLT